MDFEVRQNESGELERKVVSWEKVEISVLEGEVSNKEEAQNAAKAEREAVVAQLAAIDERLSSGERELTDLKSQLEMCRSVATPSAGVDDSGTESADVATEAVVTPDPEPAESSVPVPAEGW